MPCGPATNATWAWTLRRFARAAVWFLPGYAVFYGILTFGSFRGKGQPVYLTDARPWHLLGWVAAIWLGMMALVALTALLAATRTRKMALSALMVGAGGVVLTLPFAGLPGQTPVYGGNARLFVFFGMSVYSAGWMLMGWALLKSGVFSYGDGVLLLFAGPMLGPIGLLTDTAQTIGALLILIASVGVIWRSGRLLPVGAAGIAAAAAARAEAAKAEAAEGEAVPVEVVPVGAVPMEVAPAVAPVADVTPSSAVPVAGAPTASQGSLTAP
jgi:hypothetical protein